MLAVIRDLMCRVEFPAGENVAFLPMSCTFTSASSSPGANATRRTEVASAGMPGRIWVLAGSAEAASQSLPTSSSAALTTAPTRPVRVVTWTVTFSAASLVRVEISMGTLDLAGTVMPSPTSDLRAPSAPNSSMSATAAVSSGLVRWT